MSTEPSADRRYHELVRYAYLEQLVAQQRVLVVGAVNPAACDRLAELRARFVLGVTDDEALLDELQSAGGPENVSYQAMSLSALNFRDGSFDVVVVPDLAALGDAEASLQEIRRVLTPEGVALISLANREAMGGLAAVEPPELGYTELFELCSGVWSIVRMVGQSPFVGYVVADFAPDDEEPGISFDASLAPDDGEEVEFYLAVCSDEPVEIDPYAIVQMPLAAVVPQEVDARSEGDDTDPGLAEALDRERERAVEHNLRAQRLEHELKAMSDEAVRGRDRAARFARELEEEKKARQRAEIEGQMARRSPELGELRDRVAALTTELESARTASRVPPPPAAWEEERRRLERSVAALRADLEAAQRARTEAQERADRLQRDTRVDDLRRQLTDRDRGLAERDGRVAELERELEARPGTAALEALQRELDARPTRAAVSALEARARLLEEQVQLLRSAAEEGDREGLDDLGRLETELRERSRLVADLEAEVARREAIVRDLSAHLETALESAPETGERSVESSRLELESERASATERAEIVEGRLAVELGRIRELEARLVGLEDERQAGSWRIAELEAQLGAVQKGLVEVDVAAAMTRGYRMRIAELEEELGRGPDRSPDLERELEACRAHAAELARQLTECRQRGREVDDSARTASGTATRLETYARELEGELAASRHRVDETEGELAPLRARVQDLQAELAQREDRIDELQETSRQALGRAQELESSGSAARLQLDESAARLQASETDASFARHMAAMVQEELLELRSILSIRDAQLAQVEGARRGFRARTRELEIDDDQRLQHQLRLQDRVGELEAESSTLARRVETLEAARLELVARAEAAAQREREAESMVRRLMEDNDAQRVRLREALERGDVLLAELEARQGDVVDARRERQNVESTAGDLRRRLEHLEQERDGLRHELEPILRLRQDLEFRLEARERELAEVRAAHSSLEGDFRSARAAAELRAQELHDLRRAAEASEGTIAELRGLAQAAQGESAEGRVQAARSAEEQAALHRQVEALRTEMQAHGDGRSSGSGQEVAKLREQIRGLETAAEEMANRAATAIADAEDRGRSLRQGLEVQVERLRRELADARRPSDEPEVDALRAELAHGKDELARRRDELSSSEVLMRSLMAQLEERDGRIALIERHSREEMDRAEATMRAYDDRMLQMTEELMQLRTEHSGAQRELMALRHEIAEGSRRDSEPASEASVLRLLLDTVRRDLARLSDDPRAEVLLEDIRAILRRLRS